MSENTKKYFVYFIVSTILTVVFVYLFGYTLFFLLWIGSLFVFIPLAILLLLYVSIFVVIAKKSAKNKNNLFLIVLALAPVATGILIMYSVSIYQTAKVRSIENNNVEKINLITSRLSAYISFGNPTYSVISLNNGRKAFSANIPLVIKKEIPAHILKTAFGYRMLPESTMNNYIPGCEGDNFAWPSIAVFDRVLHEEINLQSPFFLDPNIHSQLSVLMTEPEKYILQLSYELRDPCPNENFTALKGKTIEVIQFSQILNTGERKLGTIWNTFAIDNIRN